MTRMRMATVQCSIWLIPPQRSVEFFKVMVWVP